MNTPDAIDDVVDRLITKLRDGTQEWTDSDWREQVHAEVELAAASLDVIKAQRLYDALADRAAIVDAYAEQAKATA